MWRRGSVSAAAALLVGTCVAGHAGSQRLVTPRVQRVGVSVAASPRGPWPPRRRVGVRVVEQHDGRSRESGALDRRRLRALGLRGGERTQVGPSRWPREPRSPQVVDRARFRRAVVRLCPRDVPEARAVRIADAAVDSAEHFRVDPFVVAALAYHQSGCGSDAPDSWGLGVARVNLGTHRSRLRRGVYVYGQPAAGGRFAPAELPMDRFPATPSALRALEPNLYFTAGLLRIFSEQCPYIDAPFASVEHRHPVSHMIWGDHVRSVLPENLILTARRRVLAYYGAKRARRRVDFHGVTLASPLDGPPRIVSGLMGDDRPSGRVHAGVDLLGRVGEPVRAMADGVVVFAGVDTLGRGPLHLSAVRAVRVPAARMAPRGLFVRIDHGKGIETLYVHLSEYTVSTDDRVRLGDVIGYVGRTGMRTSDAHLHLGIFHGDTVVDPLPHLGPLMVAGDDVPVVAFSAEPDGDGPADQPAAAARLR